MENTCCFSQNMTAIPEINVEYNIYVGFNVTNTHTIYITRCHKAFLWEQEKTFPTSIFWSGNSLVPAFIVSQSLLITVVVHFTSQTSPVKQTVWVALQCHSLEMSVGEVWLSVSDVPFFECSLMVVITVHVEKPLIFHEQEIMCCTPQGFFSRNKETATR